MKLWSPPRRGNAQMTLTKFWRTMNVKKSLVCVKCGAHGGLFAKRSANQDCACYAGMKILSFVQISCKENCWLKVAKETWHCSILTGDHDRWIKKTRFLSVEGERIQKRLLDCSGDVLVVWKFLSDCDDSSRNCHFRIFRMRRCCI